MWRLEGGVLQGGHSAGPLPACLATALAVGRNLQRSPPPLPPPSHRTPGTRILTQFLTVMALGCAPLLVLLQQLCLLALLPQPEALCAAPLLADPLTHSRMGLFWEMLQLLLLLPSYGGLSPTPDAGALPKLALLPLRGGGALAAGEQVVCGQPLRPPLPQTTLPWLTSRPSAPAAGADLRACVGVVRYLQIVAGVMLPVAASGCLSRLLRDPQPREEPGHGTAAAAVRSAGRRHGWHAAAGPATALRLAADRVTAAWARLDCCLAEGCQALVGDPFDCMTGAWVLSFCACLLAGATTKAALQDS